jgi:hypothetical protein
MEIVTDEKITWSQNNELWYFSLKVNGKERSNWVTTFENARKKIEQYKTEILEGVNKFNMLIDPETKDNPIEIDPDDLSDEEFRNPTDDMMKGLMAWGWSQCAPKIDKDNFRIYFNLHPNIWDGSLEFDFLCLKEDWVSYSYDQGGSI